MKRKILFLTGTRADFGKLKPLIHAVADEPSLDYLIVATGMHLEERYGRTETEIRASGFRNIHSFPNSDNDEAMDIALARTITGLSKVVSEFHPDLITVHGDRVEALAGAIVGALNNVRVAHIEGGELSGTVDEALRHAITKLSHVHFVANESAANVLSQLGEEPSSVFAIGSPEVDIMLSPALPSRDELKSRYDIPFESFAILIYHPVTTELDRLAADIAAVIQAALESEENFLVLYPNNDLGSGIILEEFRRLVGNPRFRVLPSMRFEYFQSALKTANFILGNSSSGVREAPVHGTPAVNVGSRQHRRSTSPLIVNTAPLVADILSGITKTRMMSRRSSQVFGNGTSALRFVEILKSSRIWSTPLQKAIRVFEHDVHDD